jgi:hypothetical protein
MQLVGMHPAAKSTGEDPLPGKVNYFLGDDTTKWRPDIPTFKKVKYTSVYPGVDLVYYGNQRALEFDFVVAARASAARVQMRFLGARKLRLDEQGNLIVSLQDGEIGFHAPVAFQERAGVRSSVKAGFTIAGVDVIGFALGSYDHSRELIIDPVLTYSTYLSGNQFDVLTAMTVDAAGNAYATGNADSCDFPTTPGTFESTLSGCVFELGRSVVFVTKVNPAGSALVYSTFLGTGTASAIAVDSSGDAYVGGWAQTEFPVTPDAYQTVDNAAAIGGGNPFVVKLNPTGSALLYSTYLGGTSGQDTTYGIAVDSNGNAYLAGSAASVDFPSTAGAFQTVDPTPGLPNSFVSKLNASGTALLYSTYLGGTGQNSPFTIPTGQANAIAVDTLGNAYVAGSTSDQSFPVTPGAFQPNYTTDPSNTAPFRSTGYVAKFDATGSKLIYASYLGGNYISENQAVAVDSAANAYVTGGTTGGFNVTAGSFQPIQLGLNAFVTKINPSGTALVYSTYLGGSCQASGQLTGDTGFAIAVDATGNAYVSGQTCSVDFPLTSGAVQTTKSAPLFFDAFFSELNPAGTALLYSTYLGGSGNMNTVGDWANSIGLDAKGDVYVAGLSHSTDFPTTPGAFQTMTVATGAGFISKIAVPQGATPVIRDFSISLSPASLAIAPGQSGTATVTLTPQNGFYQNIALSCSGLPSGASCGFSNASFVLGTSAATATLTYQPPAATVVSQDRQYVPFAPVASFALGVCWLGARRRRGLVGLVLLAAILGGTIPLTSCGGGGGGGGGTSNNQYTINVTATASSAKHSSALAITLN